MLEPEEGSRLLSGSNLGESDEEIHDITSNTVTVPFDETLTAGERAASELKKSRDREHWLRVGEAFIAIREEALRRANVDQVNDSRYREAWRELIDQAPALREAQRPEADGGERRAVALPELVRYRTVAR